MATPLAPYDELTPREGEVLRLMARGLTNGQIADELDIGFETAKTHVSHVIAKTGAASREEAVANWRAWNWPGARARRWMRSIWAAPIALKAGAGAVVVAGVAAFAVLQFAGDAPDPGEPQSTVLYREFEANSSSGTELLLPFDEAIERQQEALGSAPSPDGAFLRDRGLLPHAVVVRTPQELFPGFEGITQWSVWYGDGPTEETSDVRVGVVREAQLARLAEDCEPELPTNVVESATPGVSSGPGWEQTTTPNGQYDVVYRTPEGGDLAFYAGASCLGTHLRVFGDLPHDEALAILESVLAQE